MSFALQLQRSWLHRGLLAWALLPLSWVYRTVMLLRSALYAAGLRRRYALPVQVVIVGNLVAGGAGKTPTTVALVRLLRDRGYTPGVISRGYGRASTRVQLVNTSSPAAEVGDEPLLMHLRTQAPLAVGADRVAAGRALLQAHPNVNVIVSDDGLQHLRLARQAQVMVFDERGAGNGWTLPAGPLREPVPKHVPSGSVVLYNATTSSTALPGHLVRRQLSAITELSAWWKGQITPIDNAQAEWQKYTIVAAAGLARPQRFFSMLREAGCQISELPLPDHYDFCTLPWPADAPFVIVTEKDAVKLRPHAMGSTRVWVATLDFQLSDAFAAELMLWLSPPTH